MFQSPPFPDYGCKDPDIYSCTIVVDPLKIMFIPNFFLLPVLIGIMLHTITFLGMALKKTWTSFRWFLAPKKRIESCKMLLEEWYQCFSIFLGVAKYIQILVDLRKIQVFFRKKKVYLLLINGLIRSGQFVGSHGFYPRNRWGFRALFSWSLKPIGDGPLVVPPGRWSFPRSRLQCWKTRSSKNFRRLSAQTIMNWVKVIPNGIPGYHRFFNPWKVPHLLFWSPFWAPWTPPFRTGRTSWFVNHPQNLKSDLHQF